MSNEKHFLIAETEDGTMRTVLVIDFDKQLIGLVQGEVGGDDTDVVAIDAPMLGVIGKIVTDHLDRETGELFNTNNTTEYAIVH